MTCGDLLRRHLNLTSNQYSEGELRTPGGRLSGNATQQPSRCDEEVVKGEGRRNRKKEEEN